MANEPTNQQETTVTNTPGYVAEPTSNTTTTDLDFDNHTLTKNYEAAASSSYYEDELRAQKKKAANKDMLYGALWCVGGLIGTFANTGFIFWGAIVFGGFQFFRGLINSSGN